MVLASFANGRVDEGGKSTDIAWTFARPTDLVAWKLAKRAVKAISDFASGQVGQFVTTSKCTSLHQHNKFQTLPAEFVTKKTIHYLSESQVFERVKAAVNLAPSTLRWAWIVKAKDGKMLLEGVCVINKKELTLKQSETFEFSY